MTETLRGYAGRSTNFWLRGACILLLLCATWAALACGDRVGTPSDSNQLILEDVKTIVEANYRAVLDAPDLPSELYSYSADDTIEYQEELLDDWEDDLLTLGTDATDVESYAVMLTGSQDGYYIVVEGDFDFDDIKIELEDEDFEEDTYRDFPIWKGDYDMAAALFEDRGIYILGNEDEVKEVIRSIDRGEGFMDNDSDLKRAYDSSGDGLLAVAFECDGNALPAAPPLIAADQGNSLQDADATIITVNNSPYMGNIERRGEVDLYAFSPSGAGTHIVETESGSLYDTVITIYAPGGVRIGSDDDGGRGEASRYEFTPSSPRTHYVAVRGYESETGSYFLSIVADESAARLSASYSDAGVHVWPFWGAVYDDLWGGGEFDDNCESIAMVVDAGESEDETKVMLTAVYRSERRAESAMEDIEDYIEDNLDADIDDIRVSGEIVSVKYTVYAE